MRGSFRRRLAALIAVVFVVGGAALLGVQYLLVTRLLEQQVDEQTVARVVRESDDDGAGADLAPAPDAATPEAAVAADPCPEGTRQRWMIPGVGEFAPRDLPAGDIDPGTTIWGMCLDADGTAVDRFEINLTACSTTRPPPRSSGPSCSPGSSTRPPRAPPPASRRRCCARWGCGRSPCSRASPRWP